MFCFRLQSIYLVHIYLISKLQIRLYISHGILLLALLNRLTRIQPDPDEPPELRSAQTHRAMAGESIWLYDASYSLAIVAAVLYAVPTITQFYQTVLRYRAWYFLPVLVGAILEVAGYIVRRISAERDDEIVCFHPYHTS